MVVPLSLCQLQSYYMVKHKLMYMLQLNIPLQNFLILNSSTRPGFDLWIKKIPWIKEWQPTPVFLPEESHGQESLAGYSPWDRKESNTTERLTLSLLTFLPAFVLLCPNSHFGLPTRWSFVLVPYCSKGFREICFRVAYPNTWSSHIALVLKNLHAAAGNGRDTGSVPGSESSSGVDAESNHVVSSLISSLPLASLSWF